MSKKLVLIGAGHAHVEVVRRWIDEPVAECDLVVIDPNPRPIYSGMVPGLVAGQYTKSDLEIDLPRLCERAGAEHVGAPAVRVDAEQRLVQVGGRARGVGYDVASIDIGSTVLGKDLPGVREHVLATRPMDRFIDALSKELKHAKQTPDALHRYCVVGAGAGGVELALCLHARLQRDAVSAFEVVVVTSDPGVLPGASRRLRAHVERAMERAGVRIVADARVASIRDGALELADGRTIECNATLWSTGPAAHGFAVGSKLPVDENGFVLVQPTLQVETYDDLFAVGDCASLPGMRKAGVYAVRSAPLLDTNLRARIVGGRLASYNPQRDFLSLLNLGDGTAIGAKWGLVWEGRAMMSLKDRIDRAFMEKYR